MTSTWNVLLRARRAAPTYLIQDKRQLGRAPSCRPEGGRYAPSACQCSRYTVYLSSSSTAASRAYTQDTQARSGVSSAHGRHEGDRRVATIAAGNAPPLWLIPASAIFDRPSDAVACGTELWRHSAIPALCSRSPTGLKLPIERLSRAPRSWSRVRS